MTENIPEPDDGPNMDDALMRAAFDPNFKFAPIPERTEDELLDARYRAAERSKEMMKLCPLCGLPPKVVGSDEFGYPRTVNEFHATDCPAIGSA